MLELCKIQKWGHELGAYCMLELCKIQKWGHELGAYCMLELCKIQKWEIVSYHWCSQSLRMTCLQLREHHVAGPWARVRFRITTVVYNTL